MLLTEYGKTVVLFTQKLLINFCLFWQRKLYGSDIKQIDNTDSDIALQAQHICEKYTEQRLSNSSPKYREVFKTRLDENICSKEVIKTMNKYGKILEKSYPSLYTNVVQQMNFRVNYEIVICGLFTCVCDNILAEGKTWAKIVSIYAFAAALAEDCCRANDFKTAKNISKWMGQYISKRLVGWIRRHGGWDGFVVHFNSGSLFCSSGGRCRWIERIAVAIAGIGATTLCAAMLQTRWHTQNYNNFAV